MPINQLLIVEDEIKRAKLLRDYFRAEGFDVHMIHHGSAVVGWVKRNRVNAVILDIMLPGKDGVAICREIREFSDVPILMVTARVDEIDRLLALELGADDYICKPFSPREVVAWVKAILRRINSELVQVGDWQLDAGRFEFVFEDIRLALTATEFHMMSKLCSDPGRIYSRTQLMEGMYTDNRIVSERTIDSHLKKLRIKLAGAFGDTECVESVYGVGYRIVRPLN